MKTQARAGQRIARFRPRLSSVVPISEATSSLDLPNRSARVCIITEGLGNLKDKNYYSEDAIKSAARVFEGKRFFIDHPSRSEDEDRPERSVRDLAGYFYECQLGKARDPETGEQLAACYAKLKFAESEPGNLALGQVVAALEYQRRFPQSKEVYCGISINGGGVSHQAQIKGVDVNMVTEIQEAFSADIVTMPARGGKFLALISESFRSGEPLKASGASTRAKAAQEESTMADGKGTDGKDKVKGKESKRPKFERRFRESFPKTLKLSRRVVKEAGARLTKLKEDEAAEAKLRLGRLGERLKNLSAALNAPKADAKTIAADIKNDLEELLQATGMGAEEERGYEDEKMTPPPMKRPAPGDQQQGGGQQMGGDPTNPGDVNPDLEDEDGEEEAEGYEDGEEEAEGAEEGGEEESGEEEDEGYEDSGEEEDEEGEEHAGDLGMDDGDDLDDAADDDQGMDDDDQDGMHKDEQDEQASEEQEARMRFKCAKCNEDNVVLPPKGMRLVAAEEAERAREAAAYKSTVSRLQRTLEAKEARMAKQNVKVKETSTTVEKLFKENRKLKAENIAMKRISEAKKVLREAGVSKKILSAADLVQFEPHQWAAQIKLARKTVVARESGLYGGGQRGGDGGRQSEQQMKDAAAKAVSKFDAEYAR